MTIDLDTMLPDEIDALIEMAEKEKKEATTVSSAAKTILSNKLEQAFESMMPADAEIKYPLFGFHAERIREMYALSGDVTVKYPDKSKKSFSNVTMIHWLDENETYNPVAFFSEEDIYQIDETYYAKSLRYLDEKTVKRINSAGVVALKNIKIEKAAEPTQTPSVKSTEVPIQTPAPTLTPTPTPIATESPVLTSDTESVVIYAKINKAVNIRQKPNGDSKKMGSAKVGESFLITCAYYTDTWHQIDYKGKICYVSAKYCDIVEKSEIASKAAVAAAAVAVQSATLKSDDTKTYSSGTVSDNNSSDGDVGYIGNRNTKKFHETYCSSVDDMKEKNKVTLTSREAAIKKGYVPCKKCNP